MCYKDIYFLIIYHVISTIKLIIIAFFDLNEMLNYIINIKFIIWHIKNSKTVPFSIFLTMLQRGHTRSTYRYIISRIPIDYKLELDYRPEFLLTVFPLMVRDVTNRYVSKLRVAVVITKCCVFTVRTRDR